MREYMLDMNATKAAVRAGYSQRTAKQIGCNQLNKPLVQAAIAAARSKLSARAEAKFDMKADDVLLNIARLAQKAEEAKRFDAALKGQELLAKHLGLLVERRVNENRNTNLNVTPEEAQALLETIDALRRAQAQPGSGGAGASPVRGGQQAAAVPTVPKAA